MYRRQVIEKTNAVGIILREAAIMKETREDFKNISLSFLKNRLLKRINHQIRVTDNNEEDFTKAVRAAFSNNLENRNVIPVNEIDLLDSIMKSAFELKKIFLWNDTLFKTSGLISGISFFGHIIKAFI